MLRKFLKKFIILKNTLEKTNGVVVLYNKSEEQDFDFHVVKRIHGEGRLLMAFNEAYQLMSLVKAVYKIKGDIVEAGSYSGRSTKIIAEAEKNKRIYGFDTFEGLPEDGMDMKNNKGLYKGRFQTDYDEAKDYLKNYPNVSLHKGYFPESAKFLNEARFSLANIDVDLYRGTHDSLAFLYPRMVKGGVMLVHDYLRPKFLDVRKAVDEFFADKPEAVIQIGGSTQCMIVKL